MGAQESAALHSGLVLLKRYDRSKSFTPRQNGFTLGGTQTKNITLDIFSHRLLERKIRMFPPFLCCVIIARRLPPPRMRARRQTAARPLRPPPRCSVALSASTSGVWRLARSQRVHSDSGPAVHFFLCRTVHGPELIPVQNGFTGAGRKRFIAALASLLKMRTNCELRLSQVRETLSRPSHIAAAGCVSACVCLKGSEIDHMIPFVHTRARTHTRTQRVHQQIQSWTR